MAGAPPPGIWASAALTEKKMIKKKRDLIALILVISREDKQKVTGKLKRIKK
jgi:hypothetical protein